MGGLGLHDYSLRFLALSLAALLLLSAGRAAAQETQFGPDDARGLLIKTVVGSEITVLTLVPVNLDEGTFGEPIDLRGRGDVRIEASRRAGESRLVHYTGYRLEPGDYAVLMMRADISQAFWDITNTFCFARFSAVLSIRAGEAAFWVPVPVSLATWPEYHAVVTNESFSAGLERFQRSTAASSNVRPSAIRTMPTAFLDLAGDAPVNVRNCVPRSFSVTHRVAE
jgi:hypothetical protein